MTVRDVRASVAGERCECGHNAQRHELPGFDGECVADGCRCTLYRLRQIVAPLPTVRPAAPARTVPPVRSGVEQLLTAGKASSSKRTVALVERIERDVTDLYARLRAERAMTAAESAAAAARAILTAPVAAQEPLPGDDLDIKPERAPAADRKAPTPKTCPVCEKVCASGTGLSAHQRNAHGDNTPVQCPDCGTPVIPAGLGAHRRHTHGYRKAG